MTQSLVDQIEVKLGDLSNAYFHLLLVVAPAGGGKTNALKKIADRTGFPYINLGLELSQRILDLTDRQRSLRLSRLIDEILGKNINQSALLDNIEILFDITLQQDPLRLLQGLSRNRIIVAAWSGKVQGNYLIYAESGHPEYRRYPIKDLILVLPD